MREGLCFLMLCVMLGCAGVEEKMSVTSSDSLQRLPGVSRQMSQWGPYHFGTQGVLVLKEGQRRFMEREKASSVLVLVRGYLDAALYGELAGDARVLAALKALLVKDGVAEHPGGEDLWASLEARYERASREIGERGEEPHRAAIEKGLRLVRALRDRSMAPDYHKVLRDLGEEGSPFWEEARLARLLDLKEGLVELKAVKLSSRVGVFLKVFGGQVCDGQEEGGCGAVCEAGLGLAREEPSSRRGVLMLATCGYEESGWSRRSSARLYSEEYAAVLSIYQQAIDDVRVLSGLEDHPLTSSVRAELFAMLSSWERDGLGVGLSVGSGGELGGLMLAMGEEDVEEEAHPGRYVTISGGEVRVGILPVLGLSEGAVVLKEGEEGFGFPGYAVCEVEGSEHLEGLKGEHLGEVYEEAGALWEKMTGEERGGEEEVRLYVERSAKMKDLRAGLELMRRGLGRGGVLRVGLMVVGGEGGLGRKVFKMTARGREVWRGVVKEARPLDVMLRVSQESVTVNGRGEEMLRLKKGEIAGLRSALENLRRSHPGEDVIEVEVEGDVSVQELVEVLEEEGGRYPERILRVRKRK